MGGQFRALVLANAFEWQSVNLFAALRAFDPNQHTDERAHGHRQQQTAQQTKTPIVVTGWIGARRF